MPAELPQLVGVPHPTPAGGGMTVSTVTSRASSWEMMVSTVRVRVRAQVKVRARVGEGQS